MDLEDEDEEDVSIAASLPKMSQNSKLRHLSTSPTLASLYQPVVWKSGGTPGTLATDSEDYTPEGLSSSEDFTSFSSGSSPASPVTTTETESGDSESSASSTIPADDEDDDVHACSSESPEPLDLTTNHSNEFL